MALADDYPHLSRLLRQRVGDGRRCWRRCSRSSYVRKSPRTGNLSAALTFDMVGNSVRGTRERLHRGGEALATNGDKIDAILDQLDRIETVVVETQAILLDIQAELQRNNGDDVRLLLVQVIERLDKQGTQRGVLQPGDSSRMQSDEERAAMRAPETALPPTAAGSPAAGAGVTQRPGQTRAYRRRLCRGTHHLRGRGRIAPGDAARAEVFFNAYRVPWSCAITTARSRPASKRRRSILTASPSSRRIATRRSASSAPAASVPRSCARTKTLSGWSSSRLCTPTTIWNAPSRPSSTRPSP